MMPKHKPKFRWNASVFLHHAHGALAQVQHMLEGFYVPCIGEHWVTPVQQQNCSTIRVWLDGSFARCRCSFSNSNHDLSKNAFKQLCIWRLASKFTSVLFSHKCGRHGTLIPHSHREWLAAVVNPFFFCAVACFRNVAPNRLPAQFFSRVSHWIGTNIQMHIAPSFGFSD